MPFQSLEDKFVYHLEEMYYVENRLVDVLDELATDVNNEDLRDGLREHQEQTRDHVDRLEDVFEYVDATPQQRESPTFDALLEERDLIVDECAGEDMADLCNHGIAAKNEHLEIAGYETLIMLARKMDAPREVRNALQANLDDEQETKKRLKAIAEDSTVREIFARLAG